MKKAVLIIMVIVGIGVVILFLSSTCHLESKIPIYPRDCEGNMRTMIQYFGIYLQTHDNKFPSSLQKLCSACNIPNNELCKCPSRKKHDPVCDYVYLVGGLPRNKVPNKMMILYDKKENHQGKGRWVMYGSFDCEGLEEEAFQKKIKEQESFLEEW